MRAVNAFVGQPIERFEDLRLLRGKGTFVDDVHRDGMLHLAVLRSPMAHGRIEKIDLAAARALPGVVAAFAADEFRSLPVIPLRLAPISGVERFLQYPIAREKVRYVGEPVAVVAAIDPADCRGCAGAASSSIFLRCRRWSTGSRRRAAQPAL